VISSADRCSRLIWHSLCFLCSEALLKILFLSFKPRPASLIMAEQCLLAVLIAASFLLFVVQGYRVSGQCMEPHLYTGDRVMVDKLAYLLHGPRREDLVVFRYPRDESEIFVKRVIGLPGETIAIKSGQVLINDHIISDPDRVFAAHGDMAPQRIPPHEYFVMGDNRDNSDDSRYWGDLPRRDLIGRTVACYWPPAAFKLFHR
jgi:signal peptidase I